MNFEHFFLPVNDADNCGLTPDRWVRILQCRCLAAPKAGIRPQGIEDRLVVRRTDASVEDVRFVVENRLHDSTWQDGRRVKAEERKNTIKIRQMEL